jgi:clan AA aspartic protease (TIGR02281 family)
VRTKSILILLACMFSLSPKVCASPEFDQGVAAFRKNDFNGALTLFQKALRANPNDSNAIYYKAVTFSKLGQTNEAKRCYAILIQSYPGTPAGVNAATAMAYIDPAYLRQLSPQSRATSGGGGSAGSFKIDSAPEGAQTVGDLVGNVQTATVYFENVGNSLFVPASINNRPFKMIFDSGAAGCTIGLNEMTELGLKPPEGKFTVQHHGVGSEGGVGGWLTTVTLKVGNIEKRNFPISVMANSATPPLLGQTFFREFNYSIDNAAKSIRFNKKVSGTQTAVRDSSSMPFKREGNHIIVDVQVNGRNIPCYLDTGASMCVFSAAHAQQLGIQVPEDARTIQSKGIAGSETDALVNVNSIRCGPISKSDFEIAVSPSMLPHPLLGQTFFGGLRYDIDEDNHLLRMRY